MKTNTKDEGRGAYTEETVEGRPPKYNRDDSPVMAAHAALMEEAKAQILKEMMDESCSSENVTVKKNLLPNGGSEAEERTKEPEQVVETHASALLVLTNPQSSRGSDRVSIRPKWIAAIRQHAPSIMAYHGRVALSAAEVLQAMKALKLTVTDVVKANGIGDALGSSGLRLPVIIGAAPKHYYLPAAMMTAAERAEFEALSNFDQVRVIREGNEALKMGNAPVGADS